MPVENMKVGCAYYGAAHMRGGPPGRRRVLRRWKNISKAMAARGFRAGGPFGGNLGNFTEGDGAVCWIGREIEPVDSVCPLRPLRPRKMTKTRVRLVTGVALLAACTLAQTQPRRLATLRLEVTDSHGRLLNDWKVTRLVDRAGREWGETVSVAGVTQIPPGQYVLTVERHGFFPFEGTLWVREPTTHFIAGVLFGGIEDTAGEDDVHGRFEIPPGENSWCKLSGLYTGRGHFTPVSADGTFRFVLVPSETYSLTCWRGSTTLEARIVDTAAGSNPEIVIPAPVKPAGSSK